MRDTNTFYRIFNKVTQKYESFGYRSKSAWKTEKYALLALSSSFNHANKNDYDDYELHIFKSDPIIVNVKALISKLQTEEQNKYIAENWYYDNVRKTIKMIETLNDDFGFNISYDYIPNRGNELKFNNMIDFYTKHMNYESKEKFIIKFNIISEQKYEKNPYKSLI